MERIDAVELFHDQFSRKECTGCGDGLRAACMPPAEHLHQGRLIKPTTVCRQSFAYLFGQFLSQIRSFLDLRFAFDQYVLVEYSKGPR